MNKITKEDVENIALLSRLEVSVSDMKKYQNELSAILSYIETIQKADTKNVDSTAQVTGLSDIIRDDIKKPSVLSRDDILSNAPDKKEGYIKVKAVL